MTESYRTSRWGAWAYYGISEQMLEAYDCVRFWPDLDALAGGNARAMIENDLFTDMVEFVAGFEQTYSNMSPTLWRGMIFAGRVLDRPEWIREAMGHFRHFVVGHFLYDGCWQEPAPSYVTQTYRSLANVLEALRGYVPPDDARDLDETIGRNRLALTSIRRARETLLMPDGGEMPIGDTWRRAQRPSARTASYLLGGFGLAGLGGGEGEHQVRAWLNFTGGIGHAHADALSIGLFAYGTDLLSDIGYTHTAWRSWTVATQSHNTVVVNGVTGGHDRDWALNRARLFATDGQGFHLAEADGEAAYPGVARRYRRTLLLAGRDSRDAYLLDIFQVHGGEQHDYVLLGPLDEDATGAVSGATLAPYAGSLMNPGTPFTLPRAESDSVGPAGGYGFVRNLSAGAVDTEVVLDFRLVGATDTGARTRLLPGSRTTAYLGEAPSIRRAGSQDRLLGDFYAPYFCARRQGENLQSVFIATHEPVKGAPGIRSLTTRPFDGGVLVTVDRGERGRDHFVMAFDAPVARRLATADGALTFDGAYGFVRVRNGRPTEAHLIDGKALRLSEAEVAGATGWEGRVLQVHLEPEEGAGGWFEVAETIADATGAALIVEFADQTVRSYNVTRVTPRPNGTRLHVAENPGFVVEGDVVRLVTFHQRDIQGSEIRYRLPAMAFWRMDEGTTGTTEDQKRSLP